MKCKRPTPCRIQSSNIEKFAIEEDTEINPPSVKIYFEGTLAWYEIVSAHPSYAAIFANMQLKAQIWLWIQLRRSAIVVKSITRTTWPSLKQLHRDFPSHLQSRGGDLIDAFHSYFIERIIQSHLSGEALSVGPEGVNPQWMECQAVIDLQNKYPVCLCGISSDCRLCGDRSMIVLKRLEIKVQLPVQIVSNFYLPYQCVLESRNHQKKRDIFNSYSSSTPMKSNNSHQTSPAQQNSF